MASLQTKYVGVSVHVHPLGRRVVWSPKVEGRSIDLTQDAKEHAHFLESSHNGPDTRGQATYPYKLGRPLDFSIRDRLSLQLEM